MLNLTIQFSQQEYAVREGYPDSRLKTLHMITTHKSEINISNLHIQLAQIKNNNTQLIFHKNYHQAQMNWYNIAKSKHHNSSDPFNFHPPLFHSPYIHTVLFCHNGASSIRSCFTSGHAAPAAAQPRNTDRHQCMNKYQFLRFRL